MAAIGDRIGCPVNEWDEDRSDRLVKTNQISAMRIGFLMIGTTLLFASLIVRLFFLQVVNASAVVASSEKARNFHKILPPTRGLILDRNNRTLAQNTATYVVSVEKKAIQDATATVMQIGSILDLPRSEIERDIAALLKPEAGWREIAKSIPEEKIKKLDAANIPGVATQAIPIRYYPEGTLASHVIGFTGLDDVGLAGLELTLNDKIVGTAQPIITDKDIRRRMIAEDDYTKIMTRGVDFVLTLDSYIQYVVERELKKVCEETQALQAQAVVMIPATGDILAMANYPTFDPNQYEKYSDYERRNRLLVDVFEPGSIIKPFIVCAALEQKAVTVDTVFYCERGSYYFKGHTIRDDIHHFENLTVHDILVRSSNIGMVKITQRLGQSPDDFRGQAEVVCNYLTRFGFKNTPEKTTDDLPGESAGRLNPPNKWWPANIGAVPFGQGVTTNTLILAAGYSALANRGMYVKPRVILGKRRPDGLFQPTKPEKPIPIVSKEVVEQVVKMMVDVTENPEGTGYGRVRIPGFHICGKTGTAQKVDPETRTYGRGMRIASFGGFFPAENPQAVIIVVVDQPKNKKYGGEISGPVFKKIAEELIAYWGMSPTDKNDPLFVAALSESAGKNKSGGKIAATARPTPPFSPFGVSRQAPISKSPGDFEATGSMPDLAGLPVREAYIQLVKSGVRSRFEGAGKVIAQPIAAGTPLTGTSEIGVVKCEPMLTDPEIQSGSAWVVQR